MLEQDKADTRLKLSLSGEKLSTNIGGYLIKPNRVNSFILQRANPRILSPSLHFSLNCSLFQVLWRIDFPIIIIVFPNFTGRDFSLFFLLFLSYSSYHFPALFFLSFSLPSHSFSYHRMKQTRLLWGFARPYKALFSSISHSSFSLLKTGRKQDMTWEIKEIDRKMRRNIWNNSRKLQGLFLTLSFSRWNLEEKNTGITSRFLGLER